MFRNAGSSFLYKTALDHCLSGEDRKSLKLSDTESELWRESYFEQGWL